MTTASGALGEFLRGLLRDEDAAQQYLLDPRAALTAAGLSLVTAADIRSAADTLGLADSGVRSRNASAEAGSDVTEVIRNVLQHNYIGGDAYRNILSCGDLSQEFDPAAEHM